MIRRVPRALWLSALFGTLCFVYRYLTFRGFTNDHYVHLSRAQQVLLGEWPVRDFIDPGQPLSHLLSAMPQALFGRTLLSEAILVFACLGLAAALTCWIVVRLTGSYLIASAMTLLQILILPRSYSFPKLLLYPIAAIAIAWYVRAPSAGRGAVLGVVTVVSFLMRYDHGVFIAAGCAAALMVTHWPEGPTRLARAVGEYAIVAALMLAPYLIYIQWAAGLPSHVRDVLAFGRGDAESRPTIVPTFALEPRSALTLQQREATIHVRWADGLDAAERPALESGFGMTPVDFLEDRTWRYRIADVSRSSIERIVRHAKVEDTAGIDRGAYTVDADRFDDACLICVAAGPGLHATRNAEAWLYYLAWAAVLGGLALAFVRPEGTAPALVAALVVITALAAASFVRSPLAARLPDVWGILPILLGVVSAAAFRARRWRPPLRTVCTAVLLATAASVSVVGRVREEVNVAGFAEGRARIAERFTQVSRELARGPGAAQRSDPAVGAPSVRDYVIACTAPADRLLVFGFIPETFYFTGRGFAAGYLAFIEGYHDSEAEQRLGLARWRAQSVPLVVAYEREFLELSEPFSLIAEEIGRRYRRVYEFDAINDRGPVLVFAERSRVPAGSYSPLGTPCFVAADADAS